MTQRHTHHGIKHEHSLTDVSDAFPLKTISSIQTTSGEQACSCCEHGRHVRDGRYGCAKVYEAAMNAGIPAVSGGSRNSRKMLAVEGTHVALSLCSSHTGTASTPCSDVIQEGFEASPSAFAAGKGGESAA